MSGPLLDRIDLHVDVPAVPVDAINHAPAGEGSAAIRARVEQAQVFRRERGQACPNGRLRPREVAAHCRMTPPAAQLLTAALTELHLSARSYTKIVTVARTIGDLAGHETIRPDDVAEAIQYRSLDRQWWG